MTKKLNAVLVLVLLLSAFLTGCASQGSGKIKVGLVTDTGGVNDKSFNQSAWEGVQKAAKDFNLDAKFIESKQPTDYEKNIKTNYTSFSRNTLSHIWIFWFSSPCAFYENSFWRNRIQYACSFTYINCYDPPYNN